LSYADLTVLLQQLVELRKCVGEKLKETEHEYHKRERDTCLQQKGCLRQPWQSTRDNLFLMWIFSRMFLVLILKNSKRWINLFLILLITYERSCHCEFHGTEKIQNVASLWLFDQEPPLEEKMFYFQYVLRLPARCFIPQKDVSSFQNILKITEWRIFEVVLNFFQAPKWSVCHGFHYDFVMTVEKRHSRGTNHYYLLWNVNSL
jgi:hypothetical protein